MMFLLFELFLLLFVTDVHSIGPRVKTKFGIIEGNRIYIRGVAVDEFVGVPFAKPPIGNLRFARPQELTPWKGVYNATTISAQCPQPNQYVKHSEDCLYLNIWRPAVDSLKLERDGASQSVQAPSSQQGSSRPPTNQPSQNTEEQIPPELKLKNVFHYIHGGGYLYGSAMEEIFNASSWPVMSDVILVAQNYRLGVFGFFHGNQTDSPGNIAIWDQAMALTWVKENIRAFGGDPNRITLFGQSAGSASVGMHITSPLTRNLYQRAIMMSGSAFVNPPAETNVEKSKKLAGYLGCDANSNTWVNCVRKVSAAEILRVSQAYPYFSYGPNYGDDLYPEPAPQSLLQGHYNGNLNLMNGLCEEEGTYVLFIYCSNIPGFERSNPKHLTRNSTAQCIRQCIWHPAIRESAVDYYLGNTSESDQRGLRLAASRAIGDLMFTCPTHFFAQMFAKRSTSNNVYGYHNTYKSRYSYFCWGSEWAGVCHADELFMLFGDPIRRPQLYNGTDVSFAEMLIKDWTTYGKTGLLPRQGQRYWPSYQQAPMDHSVAGFYIDPAGQVGTDMPIWPNYMELSPFLLGNLVYNPYKGCMDFWGKHLDVWFPTTASKAKYFDLISKNKVFKKRTYFYGTR